MTYKSLLTILTDPKFSEGQLDAISNLAKAWDAHAEVLCLGVDRTQIGFSYAGANAMVLQQTLGLAQDEASKLHDIANRYLQDSGLRWSAEDLVCTLVELARPIAHRARFSDLIVMPQPYGPDRGPEMEPVVEAALFEGRAGVLVLPDGMSDTVAPRRISIAWNQSPEALSAVRAALPFLTQAEQVRIVVVDPPQQGPERSDPGGLLAVMLARHGVTCDVDIVARSMPRISDVLNRHAVDNDSEMVVMGAYGHSRFREAILGGATRNMLEQAKVPVLLAH